MHEEGRSLDGLYPVANHELSLPKAGWGGFYPLHFMITGLIGEFPSED
jgi:hypothetical protein